MVVIQLDGPKGNVSERFQFKYDGEDHEEFREKVDDLTIEALDKFTGRGTELSHKFKLKLGNGSTEITTHEMSASTLNDHITRMNESDTILKLVPMPMNSYDFAGGSLRSLMGLAPRKTQEVPKHPSGSRGMGASPGMGMGASPGMGGTGTGGSTGMGGGKNKKEKKKKRKVRHKSRHKSRHKIKSKRRRTKRKKRRYKYY